MGVGPCQTSKGTGRSDDDAMPEISSGPGSSYSFSGVGCQPEEKNERTREVRVVISGDRIDHVESSESGGSVKADQLPREKLWSAIESASSCSGQAVEDIELSHWIQCTSVPQETRMRGSTIGEGGDTTISSPERSPKQTLQGIGLHDPLHD